MTPGYGHVTPVTPVGKLICIIYAMIGIPFTLVFLSAVVQRLLSPTFRFLGTLLAKLGSRIDPFEIRVIHLSILSTVFVIFVFFIPSAMFWKMEPSWTYLDAIYFVFISLTTIGLGDYIPGDHYVHAGRYSVVSFVAKHRYDCQNVFVFQTTETCTRRVSVSICS